MTLSDRLTVASVGFMVISIGIILASPMTATKQPSDTPRTGKEMCDEVAHELNEQYVEGMVSRKRAQEIIDRCYRLYAK